jgi:hypothetical protein
MGPVVSALRRLFDDAVHGRLPKFRKWNVPVYAELAVGSKTSAG